MSSCAIVGANGFLGREIANQLLKSNHRVFCVFNSNKGDLRQNCEQIHINEFMQGKLEPEFIFFSAGSFQSSHKQLLTINCELLYRTISIYPNAKIIYISSTNVYGVHTNIVRENSSFNSPSLYGNAKLAGEFITASADRYAIVRLTYLYGRGLDNGSFIPKLIEQACVKKKITLFGQGQRLQDYLHVYDAAALCVKLMHSKNDIFLGATGNSISNTQVAETVAANIKGCTIEFQGEEAGSSCFFDPALTFEKSGWSPVVNFTSGIKEMII